MEDRYLDASKMAALGCLLAGVVHDIGTPIGSILSNNQVVRRALDKLKESLSGPQPQVAEALQRVDTLRSLAEVDEIACNRIASLVRSLKTFARRAPAQELSEVDLNGVLREAVRLIQAGFGSRLAVETDFASLRPLECYAPRLNLVFLNLLVNAGQAIEGEGKITIRTALEGEEVHVSIADTGRGIPPELCGRLFNQAFTTKPVGVGTGLGLMICKEIVVEQHGGRLSADSQVGAGSTFHVWLPLRQGVKPKDNE